MCICVYNTLFTYNNPPSPPPSLLCRSVIYCTGWLSSTSDYILYCTGTSVTVFLHPLLLLLLLHPPPLILLTCADITDHSSFL